MKLEFYSNNINHKVVDNNLHNIPNCKSLQLLKDLLKIWEKNEKARELINSGMNLDTGLSIVCPEIFTGVNNTVEKIRIRLNSSTICRSIETISIELTTMYDTNETCAVLDINTEDEITTRDFIRILDKLNKNWKSIDLIHFTKLRIIVKEQGCIENILTILDSINLTYNTRKIQPSNMNWSV